jgi:hypothetical protein
MKKCILIFTVLLLMACGQTADEKAAPLLSRIETLYGSGKYQTALDSIKKLRVKYPEAIESRKRALKIWQEASLKMTQDDIGKTDSALQATIREWKTTKSLYRKNLLSVKRDSLQVRYDALCGTVRVIHKKEKEL